MEHYKWQNFFVVIVCLQILTVGASFILNDSNYSLKQPAGLSDVLPTTQNNNQVSPFQKLNNPPEIIKAVYVTGYSAGNKKYLNYLSNLFANTEINAVVIDIKGNGGGISYNSGAPDVQKYRLYNGAIKDIDELIKFFHEKNIYVIGRIVVFQDNVYAKARPELAIYKKDETNKFVLWRDNSNWLWLDPASKDVWDYHVSLAKDAFYHGFDEVNFDYIRFPSDGKTKEMLFPAWNAPSANSTGSLQADSGQGKKTKPQVIKEFSQYLRTNLAGEKLSVDLFGQVTTNKNDMGIGQLLENAFENFDYISPMVYPSHYVKNFLGFSNPAEYPYEVVKNQMATALARQINFEIKKQELSTTTTAPTTSEIDINTSTSTIPTEVPPELIDKVKTKFRPWLQDFDMGANYNADMVKLEIQATKDALGENYNGFMLWNAGNKYTWGAVQK